MPSAADRDPALLEGTDLEEACLAGWHTLNPMLMGLTRKQVAYLLRVELLDRQREPILTRLHQRLAALRRQDEWEVLMDGLRTLRKTPPAHRPEVETQLLHRFGTLQWLVAELP